MALFSRGPSIKESLGYAIQAFGSGFMNLEDSAKKRVASNAVGAADKEYKVAPNRNIVKTVVTEFSLSVVLILKTSLLVFWLRWRRIYSKPLNNNDMSRVL